MTPLYLQFRDLRFITAWFSCCLFFFSFFLQWTDCGREGKWDLHKYLYLPEQTKWQYRTLLDTWLWSKKNVSRLWNIWKLWLCKRSLVLKVLERKRKKMCICISVVLRHYFLWTKHIIKNKKLKIFLKIVSLGWRCPFYFLCCWIYAEIQWNQCSYFRCLPESTSLSASTSQLWSLLYRRGFGVPLDGPASCFLSVTTF